MSASTVVPRSAATLEHRVVLRLARMVALPVLKLLFGFRVEGRRNLPPRGRAIVCANHASFIDPIVLQAACRWPIHYLMAGDYYRRPALKRVSRAFEAIPLEQDSGNFVALTAAGEVLEARGVVGVFPEGGISRNGVLRPFRSGAAVLALRHDAPIVPAWIAGTFAVLPRHATWPRRAPISVRFGAPVEPATQREGAVEAERAGAMMERVRSAMCALAPAGTDPA